MIVLGWFLVLLLIIMLLIIYYRPNKKKYINIRTNSSTLFTDLTNSDSTINVPQTVYELKNVIDPDNTYLFIGVDSENRIVYQQANTITSTQSCSGSIILPITYIDLSGTTHKVTSLPMKITDIVSINIPDLGQVSYSFVFSGSCTSVPISLVCTTGSITVTPNYLLGKKTSGILSINYSYTDITGTYLIDADSSVFNIEESTMIGPSIPMLMNRNSIGLKAINQLTYSSPSLYALLATGITKDNTPFSKTATILSINESLSTIMLSWLPSIYTTRDGNKYAFTDSSKNNVSLPISITYTPGINSFGSHINSTLYIGKSTLFSYSNDLFFWNSYCNLDASGQVLLVVSPPKMNQVLPVPIPYQSCSELSFINPTQQMVEFIGIDSSGQYIHWTTNAFYCYIRELTSGSVFPANQYSTYTTVTNQSIPIKSLPYPINNAYQLQYTSVLKNPLLFIGMDSYSSLVYITDHNFVLSSNKVIPTISGTLQVNNNNYTDASGKFTITTFPCSLTNISSLSLSQTILNNENYIVFNGFDKNGAIVHTDSLSHSSFLSIQWSGVCSINNSYADVNGLHMINESQLPLTLLNVYQITYSSDDPTQRILFTTMNEVFSGTGTLSTPISTYSGILSINPIPPSNSKAIPIVCGAYITFDTPFYDYSTTYTIQSSPDDNNPNGITVVGTSSEYTIPLACSTSYYFSITSMNANGTSSKETTSVIKTLDVSSILFPNTNYTNINYPLSGKIQFLAVYSMNLISVDMTIHVDSTTNITNSIFTKQTLLQAGSSINLTLPNLSKALMYNYIFNFQLMMPTINSIILNATNTIINFTPLCINSNNITYSILLYSSNCQPVYYASNGKQTSLDNKYIPISLVPFTSSTIIIPNLISDTYTAVLNAYTLSSQGSYSLYGSSEPYVFSMSVNKACSSIPKHTPSSPLKTTILFSVNKGISKFVSVVGPTGYFNLLKSTV